MYEKELPLRLKFQLDNSLSVDEKLRLQKEETYKIYAIVEIDELVQQEIEKYLKKLSIIPDNAYK